MFNCRHLAMTFTCIALSTGVSKHETYFDLLAKHKASEFFILHVDLLK